MNQDDYLRAIPMWMRALAGLFVVAAVYAGALFVAESAREPLPLTALLLTAPQVVIAICVTALFAFVAVTGFPPTHLLPSAGHSWLGAAPPVALLPALQQYVSKLLAAHPAIRELWILMPEASADVGADVGADVMSHVRQDGETSETWHLIALVSAETAAAITQDWNLRRRNVQLLVMDEATELATAAWGRPLTVSFDELEWCWEDDDRGRCRMPGDASAVRAVATRLWRAARD